MSLEQTLITRLEVMRSDLSKIRDGVGVIVSFREKLRIAESEIGLAFADLDQLAPKVRASMKSASEQFTEALNRIESAREDLQEVIAEMGGSE